MNRDTESVVALTPNVGLRLPQRLKPLAFFTSIGTTEVMPFPILLSLLRPRSIWVDAALDFGDALVMAMNHRRDRNRATDQNRADRNQQTAEACNRINQSHLSPPRYQD
jgi:hypothetical protein